MTRLCTERGKGRGHAAWLGAAVALALAGCGPIEVPMKAPIPADTGPDPTISESITQADAVMTCEAIASERAGIAASLAGLDDSAAAVALRRRDAVLAQLAALKRCPS